MKNHSEHQVLNFEQAIQPLVITPSPVKGESLPGFILRAAELNGYESPMKLLHYAGMNDNEARSARPPLDKLAPLFGKTAKEMKATDLDTNNLFKGRYVQVMGHSIPSMFTSCKHAGMCLECVEENGYIDGFHELKYALICPKHQVKTVSSCFACHRPLSWHRAGLTKCSCGAELTQGTFERITDIAVLALLDILYAKLMKRPLNEAQMEMCGFPKEEMEQLSIQTLLSVIYRFGLFNDKSKEAGIAMDMEAIKTTAVVFSDWPHKFHDYLEEIHAPGANLKVSGLRAQFNSFYESFFKNIAQNLEIQFMRDAFISFGQERWKQASIHPTFVSSELANIVGINAFSKKINKHPSTIRKLVTEGLIKVQALNEGHSRHLFDLAEQQQFSFAEGRGLSIKKAAAILDIPVDILRAYRAKGYYQAKFLAAPIKLFHERDVELLLTDLMQGCELCKVFLDKSHITLAQIMRIKTTAEIKAGFIAEVTKRAIVPIGKLSDKPSGLVFDKKTTNDYLSKLKESLKGSLSFEEIKSTLIEDRDELFSLINANILKYRYQDNALRVVEDSILDFDAQFISCQKIARMKAMTKSSLINLCHLLGVDVYQTAQVDLFKLSNYWIAKHQMTMLGIDTKDTYNYAKAA